MKKQRRFLLCLQGGVNRMLILALLASIVLPCAAQGPEADHPVVLDAAVPFYPNNAQLAHIEGVVRLQVSTNGETASRIQLLDGPSILATAAKENVKTWRLKWHSQATFVATFRYKLLPDFACEADNGTVVLRLPLEVEVTAKGIQTCDPSSQEKSMNHAK
jgi:Gram-negative bacterial TonB protein C-terminal